MKVNDLVMFKPEGTYAKWFGGKFAKVESISVGSDGKNHCQVKWISPVKYFNNFVTKSHFSCDKFEVSHGNR